MSTHYFVRLKDKEYKTNIEYCVLNRLACNYVRVIFSVGRYYCFMVKNG